MCTQQQGVRSTRSAPRDAAKDGQLAAAEPKKQDIIVKAYNVRNTLYSDQTGLFSDISSHGNKYQMYIHEINSNTTWVKSIPSKTNNSMIAARVNGLTRMRAASLDPKYQLVDYEASVNYKATITSSDMTYQLLR